VKKTFFSIIKSKGVFLFIIAYFFYIDGVNTVIHMATAYGKTIGLGTIGLIAALLVTQIVAITNTI
jgi:UMF1 family MFS transporter